MENQDFVILTQKVQELERELSLRKKETEELKEALVKVAYASGESQAKLSSPCNFTFREIWKNSRDFCIVLSTKVYTMDSFFTSQAEVTLKVTEKSTPSFKSEIRLRVEKRGEQYFATVKGRNEMKSGLGFPRVGDLYTDGNVLYVSVNLSEGTKEAEVKVRIDSVDDWEVKVVTMKQARLNRCEFIVPFEEKQKVDSVTINRTSNDPTLGFYETVAKYIGKEVGSSAIIVKTGNGKIYWPQGIHKDVPGKWFDEPRTSGNQKISFYIPDYWVASVLRTGENDISGTLWAGGEVFNLVNVTI